MASNKICPRDSLCYAYSWETFRAGWLYRHNRKTEALAAEMEVSKYRQRIRDEIGVEVN